jgi:hypothetical protein
MASEIEVFFRMKYVRGDTVWYQPERGESNSITFDVSGNEATESIQSFTDLEGGEGIDTGDAAYADGTLVFLENINESGYLDIIDPLDAGIISRLHPGDTALLQVPPSYSGQFYAQAESGTLDLLVIAIDP